MLNFDVKALIELWGAPVTGAAVMIWFLVQSAKGRADRDKAAGKPDEWRENVTGRLDNHEEDIDRIKEAASRTRERVARLEGRHEARRD